MAALGQLSRSSAVLYNGLLYGRVDQQKLVKPNFAAVAGAFGCAQHWAWVKMAARCQIAALISAG